MATTLRGGLQPRWAVRATTLLVWTLALFSAAYWVLRIVSTPVGAPTVPPVARTPPPPNPAAVASLLGATTQAAAAPGQANLASRFVLTGVVANPSGGGAALIAVDGRPPRPYLVGQPVDENLLVQAVEGRRVMLGEKIGGPHAVVLELPALAQP